MKSYSFVSEMTVNDNDLEFLYPCLTRCRDMISNTDGAGELGFAITNCIEELKKEISESALKGYTDIVKKFKKSIVKTLILQIQNFRIMDEYNGGGLDLHSWKTIFTPKYIKFMIEIMDDKGLLCEDVKFQDSYIAELKTKVQAIKQR